MLISKNRGINMKLKKLFIIICAVCCALALACGVAACNITISGDDVGDISVVSVVLDKSELELEVDGTYALTATVIPDNATDKSVTWKSSDESVATVEKGIVTAKAVGSATITATAGGKSATCSVTVAEKSDNTTTVPVASIALDKSSLDLEVEKTYTLVATITPDNATDKSVTWTSSDESVATVDKGVVTAIKVGNATITAKAGEKSAECKVTVKDKQQTNIPVTGVTLNKSSLELKEGESSEKLIATVSPDNATDKSVTWKSSDESVATVEDGVVTAHKEGTAVITAEAGDKSAPCTVTVTKNQSTNIPVTGVTLNKSSLELKEGESSEKLIATVSPDNATDKSVTWKSSDESVATVEDGVVTAHKEGTAVITAEAGDKSAPCTVTVTKNQSTNIPVTGVTLNKSSLELKEGESSEKLIATVSPDNATDKSVTWKSSDESVATVEDGIVTAHKEGTAVITAEAGDKSAECKVTVKPARIEVDSITLNPDNLELEVGGSGTITYTINPSNATDNEVTWDSTDKSVATVADGVVTALKAGETTITASVGGKSAKCTVTVIDDNTDPDPVDPPKNSIITYAHAGEESAAFEWNDTNAANAKVAYKLSSDSSYTNIDKKLIRQISDSKVRADILGLKGGEKHDFRITASDGTVEYVKEVDISSIDRSGYAHVGVKDGVGAYNNDGTLKSNATVIYVDEATKNNVVDRNGNSQGKSIAEYLISKANNANPIVIRIIGTVGSATWNELKYRTLDPNKENDYLDETEVVGLNKQQLPKKENELTQEYLSSKGYNTINYTPAKYNGERCEVIKGLNSKATYTAATEKSYAKYDSCWNDCSVSNLSNVTVEGVGEDAEIFQWGFTFKNCNSIEVRNLRFYDYTEDACSFEGGGKPTKFDELGDYKRFWVHHNIFDIGMNYWDVCDEQDKGDGDGATDFKRLSYVTIAYNRYNGTHKTGLVGSGDDVYQAHFTFHHNYYNGCDQRMPLGRQADMHLYNNYYSNSGLCSVSLRASAYAFIENCAFTSKKSSTMPIELKSGSNGKPAAKVINCSFDDNPIKNGVGDDYLYKGNDKTATVKGDNEFLNFDTKSDFATNYKVSSMLELSKVKSTIPKVAGRYARNNNIKVAGSQEDPPAEIDVTFNVADAVDSGILSLGEKQNMTNVELTDGIVLNTTGSNTKVDDKGKTFDEITFTHRIVIKGKGNYFKISVSANSTIKVYAANGSSTDSTERILGLYTTASGDNVVAGTTEAKLVGGDTKVVEFFVAEAGDYYLESPTNELGIFAIDIVESGDTGGGSTTEPTDKKTYTYTYGGDNGEEWTVPKDTGVSDDKSSTGTKITASSTLILTANGTKITVTMKGFTTGSGSASEWVKIILKAADGTTVGTIKGTTPANKAVGNYTFTNGGVLTASGQFTSIEIAFEGTEGKNYCITELTITVE